MLLNECIKDDPKKYLKKSLYYDFHESEYFQISLNTTKMSCSSGTVLSVAEKFGSERQLIIPLHQFWKFRCCVSYFDLSKEFIPTFIK